MTEFEYYYLFFIIIATVGIRIDQIITSNKVWVKGGYEGLNKRLELHEVTLYRNHQVVDLFVWILVIVILWEPLLKEKMNWVTPWDTKLLCASVIGLTEAYAVFRKKLNRIASLFKGEEDKK